MESEWLDMVAKEQATGASGEKQTWVTKPKVRRL
jgi:hypothetical protein